MLIDTIIWLYVLLFLGLVALLCSIKRISKLRVWIKMRPKGSTKLSEIGYLVVNDDGTAGEVFLPGGERTPIGHVKVDTQLNRMVGFVDVLSSDLEDIADETAKTRYLECGYICFDKETVVDQYGYIYKQVKGRKKKELLGYCARPSAPDIPTITGERSWKTLWMICTLNAYMGKPSGKTADKSETENDGHEESVEQVNALMNINAGKIKKVETVKEVAATCHYYGFHSSSNDCLPAEARACAYALLCRPFQRPKYKEYYKDRPYGWRDTAMLTSLIYSILFLLLYTVNTGVLQMPLLGNDFRAVAILTVAYFLLWAIVRLVKIDFIENGHSFQPRLDLFNKNLNLGVINFLIVFLAILAVYFTYYYYDFDFLPLILVISWGVGVNTTLNGANRKWIIKSTFSDKESSEEEDEEKEVVNPAGDISRQYEWDLDNRFSSQELHGSLTLYFSAQEVADLRQCNPFFSQRKDKSSKEYIIEMFDFVADPEHKTFRTRARYIVSYLLKMAERHHLTPLAKIQFTLDFVQEPNIMFAMNKDCKSINYFDDYIRYPDETLFDKEGDCNSKALLAAFLFHLMGYGVLYLSSRKYHHSAIGIKVNPKDLSQGWYGDKDKIGDITVQENGHYYIYCETTGDHFRIGKTAGDMSLDDFEDKVLLPLTDEYPDGEDDEDGLENRIYNWDLDSEEGKQLHGNLTLDFSKKEIKSLRGINPFNEYSHNNSTYEDNIRCIFDYLKEDPDRTANVKIIADYIKESIKKANYSELDMVQFALDFAQMPNINYCIDEDSMGINYTKEYMRFPDEGLYDKEGDCDCKSSLTAAIFHELGYNVLIMLSKELGHAAIGIECKDEWLDIIKPVQPDHVIREHNGRRYLYCETTGDGYRIGYIKDEDSIQNFEILVEIPV